jgi:hypothetical protein
MHPILQLFIKKGRLSQYVKLIHFQVNYFHNAKLLKGLHK